MTDSQNPVSLVALALIGVVLFVCVSQAVRQMPLVSRASGRVLAVCVTLLALMGMTGLGGQAALTLAYDPLGILLLGILVVGIATAFAATASSGLRKDPKSRDEDDRERM